MIYLKTERSRIACPLLIPICNPLINYNILQRKSRKILAHVQPIISYAREKSML